MQCNIHDCDKVGRIVGKLGLDTNSPMNLVYCAKHRKYGEDLINYFFEIIYEHKFQTFINDNRRRIFRDGEIHFCNNCTQNIYDFTLKFSNKINELETASLELTSDV